MSDQVKSIWTRTDGKETDPGECCEALSAALSIMERERVFNDKIKDNPHKLKLYNWYIEILMQIRSAVQQAIKDRMAQARRKVILKKG